MYSLGFFLSEVSCQRAEVPLNILNLLFHCRNRNRSRFLFSFFFFSSLPLILSVSDRSEFPSCSGRDQTNRLHVSDHVTSLLLQSDFLEQT